MHKLIKLPATCHVLLIAIITGFTGLFHITERGPEYDETFYLNYAYSVYKYGVYGLVKQQDSEPEPSARVAPVLPFFIAMIMHSSKKLASNIECSVNKIDNPICDNNFNLIKYTELALLSICIGIVWLLLLGISKSHVFSYITIILMLLSGAPFYFADHFLTESIYLPIACVFILCYAMAIIEQDKRYLLTSSILLALLALIRPSFYYLFFMLLPFTLFFIFYCNKNSLLQSRLSLVLYFIIPFTLVISPWLARNYYYLDKPALTIGYGAQALSSRLSYNRMTDKEYLYGWIYWLPDFGDSLAYRLFGKENVSRLDFSDPDGFILHERQLIRNEAYQATGVRVSGHQSNDSISPERWLIKNYILNDFFTHIKVTALLAWRAVFIEKYFGLIGFILMIWGLINGLKKYIGHYYYYLISLPPILLVFFHAFLTVSIPRYNILLLLPMSIAMAAVLITLYHWLENKAGISRHR